MNAPIVARAILLLLLLTAGAAYAQEIEPAPSDSLSSEESMFESMDRPNSFYAGMPSPTAASLGKFGDVPASLYTGMAQISIPLYELKGRVLSLPIVLNHHASGVKVEEIPGWAGLGWSLDAGGVITRSVRGLPDDQADGYINGGGTTLQSNLSNPGNQYLRNVSNRLIDAEPDVFMYNIGGRSGKIVFSADGTPRPVPFVKMDIQHIPVSVGTDIDKWQITTEDGTKYVFGKKETTTDLERGIPYTSSWYLTSITAPASSDQIVLEYQEAG